MRSPITHSASFHEATIKELLTRVGLAGDRFVGVAASLDPQRPVPNQRWNVGELTAHVLTVVWRYTRRDVRSSAGLAATFEEVAAMNEKEVAAVELSHGEVLVALRDELQALRERFEDEIVDVHERFPFHLGASIDAAGGLGNLVGELLLHGHDLAAVARTPWAIDDVDALAMVNAWVQLLPAVVDRSVAAHRGLRAHLVVPGATRWCIVAARDPESRPARDDDPVDAVVQVPASTLVLLGTARLNVARALSRGLRIIGGRRPWRAARLASLIRAP